MTTAPKPGSPGRYRAPVRAAHVEEQACPNGGLHELVNDTRANTSCAGCGETWGRLDELLRGGS